MISFVYSIYLNLPVVKCYFHTKLSQNIYNWKIYMETEAFCFVLFCLLSAVSW